MGAVRTWWKLARIRRLRHRISDLQEWFFYPVFRPLTRLWGYTIRHWVRWTESGPLVELMARGQPVVLCAWHQDILPSMAYLIIQGAQKRAWPLVLMVGDGRMGALGGYGVEVNGVRVVKGIKREPGGRVGLVRRLAQECIRTQSSPIITGDGSRGPAFEAKWGAVYLARDTGFPLVPIRTRFVRGLVLRRTWAGFMLPALPGWGRAHAATGEPLYVPAVADKDTLEACRRELERRLTALIPVTDAYLTEGSDTVADAEC